MCEKKPRSFVLVINFADRVRNVEVRGNHKNEGQPCQKPTQWSYPVSFSLSNFFFWPYLKLFCSYYKDWQTYGKKRLVAIMVVSEFFACSWVKQRFSPMADKKQKLEFESAWKTDIHDGMVVNNWWLKFIEAKRNSGKWLSFVLIE